MGQDCIDLYSKLWEVSCLSAHWRKGARRLFPAFRCLSAHGAHTRGNYHQPAIRLLESPSRREGKYGNETFLHRKDAKEGGIRYRAAD